jgi:hypothetical protein
VTTLAEVRDGLEARLNTINGLRVVPYIADDLPGYPAATIDLADIEYTSLDLAGARRAVFAVGLYVTRNVDRQQLKLYDLIDNGTGSVMAAIQADPSLGGLNVNARVLGGSVVLDTVQMGLMNLYGRNLNINVFVS